LPAEITSITALRNKRRSTGVPRLKSHFTLAWTALLLSGSATFADLPRTTAETSNYQATTRHADVVAYCNELAKQSPVARVDSLGKSAEGRDLPLLVLSEPMVKSAEEAKRSGKVVVLLWGNIHAGEVDAKEGLMMLARDFATGADRALLKDLIILIAPIFNADGNERMVKGKRSEQGGPDEVGDRENAGGLDLNRDFVKLESPEVRALVKCMCNWDPLVVLDGHTTNGSHHRHTMTYDWPRHPNAEAANDLASKLVPAAGERMKAALGFEPFVYGNFSRDRTQWDTYPAQPRYGIQYVGLRGRIAVLSESYSYASFRDRVKASLELARGVCQEAASRKDELKKLKDARPSPRLALRNKQVPHGEPRTVLGFVEVERDGKRQVTDQPKEYAVKLISKVEPILEVTRPAAYVIPAGFDSAIQCLQRHGITMQELREDIDLDVESYVINQIERAVRPFQGHTLQKVEVTPKKDARRIAAGSFIVRTDQPLGTLAGLFLEPQSEDGMNTWNFFDAKLKEGTEFPVLRLATIPPLLTTAARPLAEDRVMDRPIDIALVFGSGFPPSFSGSPLGGLTWLDDGEHYLQSKAGQLHKVHARTGRSTPFVDASKLEESLKAEPALESVANMLSKRGMFTMNPARTGALFTHQEDLYFGSFDGTPAKRLTKSTGAKQHPKFSPDGQFVAFTRAGNLFVVDLPTQTEKALTSDGGGAILNGKADWVYEEEIFNRNEEAYRWSPDSKHIVFLRLDDAPVNNFTVVNHIPTRLNVEKYAYPKVGDPNPLVKLGIANVEAGDAKFVDLGDYKPEDMLIARIGWLPEGNAAYAYLTNRVQNFIDIVFAPVTGSPPQKVVHETTKAWVDDTGPLHFLPDGSFLFSSDRTGWRHVYRYKPDGTLVNAVTTGDWEVRRVLNVDAAGEWVYFQGTKDSHIGVNGYRAKLDGTAVERLTPEAGTHAVNVNSAATMFVDSNSSFDTPSQVRLRVVDGTLIRTLDTNPVYSREEYRFGRVEQVKVPFADDFVADGLLVYPPDFDPARKYPIWIKTYAGPHSPTVVDSWGGGRVDDQMLAKLGIVVYHIDPRPASGQGAQSAWTAYKRLGVQELKDLEAAVDWVCAKPWADAKRVGLAGHSYGGYITAYALTHSKKFCAGVSGAPVTDWRLYDSIYTERYMGLPSENKEGYDASSVVKAAKNLHGRLLLLHGLMDDNVHVQNSVQFINELQRADKDFEVMVYPTARHGIGGRHYQRQILNFICRSLGVDVRVPERGDEGDDTQRPQRQRRRPE
jgi:dipeptidyl-peptidase 4